MTISNKILLNNDINRNFFRGGQYEGDLFSLVILEVLLQKLVHIGIIKVDEIIEGVEELAYDDLKVTSEEKRVYEELELDFRQLYSMECVDRLDRIRDAVSNISDPEKRENCIVSLGYDRSHSLFDRRKS
jgi:hypothetical protein